MEIDAKRLLQLGTPDDVAERSDWDRISETFSGLRGFGYTVWYPVSSVPVLLGDGAKIFAEIGGAKTAPVGRHSDDKAVGRVLWRASHVGRSQWARRRD